MPEELPFRLVEAPGHRSVLRQDLAHVPVDAFWSEVRPLADAKGRGGAGLLELPGGVMAVARDYRRGGVLGWLLARSYLDPRRPERELRILAELRRARVPVPAPLAALARRRFAGFYRLRLLTEWIADARPLPAFVRAEPRARRAAVREAARVVASAMHAGLWHRDLHPDNLVARLGPTGGVEVYLLDLDRAALRAQLPDAVRDRMLVRMARYLRRHADELAIRTGALDQVRFLAGMGLDRAARRVVIERLRPEYHRQLRRRGLTLP